MQRLLCVQRSGFCAEGGGRFEARWAVDSRGLLVTGGDVLHNSCGLGGSPEYETQFTHWAAEIDRELRANGPEARVETLSGTSATRQHIREMLGRVAAQSHPEDAFALLLIGHGTFDGTDYKFNLPGPDLTAVDLASLLNRIPARRQLVVNMTSASGASLAALARKNRIVITATRSGNEKNATVFARYWVDALGDPAADSDKNGTISALEAYRYAERKTAAYFDTEKISQPSTRC